MFSEKLVEYKIASADISVIIQGPLYRESKEGDLALRCVKSIRQFLPQAEIIISTWQHQNCDELYADKIVYSKEPPGLSDINGSVNNISKQLVSTKNGIKAATRNYILKFRADHFLINDNIAIVTDDSTQLFKQRITVTNYFIRNPLRVPMLFHISDLVQFGRKEDMLDLWSIPLPLQNELYFKKIPRFRFLGQFVGYTSLKQVPEQTLILGWLKKQGYEIELSHTCHTSYSLLKFWEQLLTSHFHVINWQRCGVEFPERFHYSFYTKKANYTESDITVVRHSLNSRFYFMRYLKMLLNKYILCWFNKVYLRSFASIALFSFSPTIARKLREYYRSRKIPSDHKLKL